MNPLSEQERHMLNSIRVLADDLSKQIHDAQQAGFTINFNINSLNGSCDRFDVYRLVQVDMRQGAN